MQPNPSRYLIVAPAWVGDMVMAQSLFKALKQQQPDCLIDLLAPAWSIALSDRMPEINHAFIQSVGHGSLGLSARYQQAQQLKHQQYSHAIVLPNSFKSALVVRWANIPTRRGYVGEWRYPLLNQTHRLDKQILYRTVDRFVALASAQAATQVPDHIPIPALNSDPQQIQTSLDKFGLSTQQPVLCLCPGAEYGPAKCWPAQHYAAIAKQHQQQQGQVWVLGSEKDKTIGEAIQSHCDQPIQQLCGQTSLSEAIDLLAASHAVVSNDSGLMHIAAALGKPLVALYGSSDPKFTPPLHRQAKILSLTLSCSPCFKRTCPLGHTHCLQNISPEQVTLALQELQHD